MIEALIKLHPVRLIYRFNEHCGNKCSLMIGRAHRRRWDFSFNESIHFKIFSKLEWWSRKLCDFCHRHKWRYPLTDSEIAANEAAWTEAYYQDFEKQYWRDVEREEAQFFNKALGEPWETGEEPDGYHDDLLYDQRDFH